MCLLTPRATLCRPTLDLAAVVGELNRRRRDLDDGADEAVRQLVRHGDERDLLRGVGALVDEQRRADDGFSPPISCMPRLRSPETRRHDGQTVEGDAVEAAAIDLPRQHGLLADGFGFAVHDAAASEHFSGARLDVGAGHLPLPPARSGEPPSRSAPQRSWLVSYADLALGLYALAGHRSVRL